MCVAELFRRGVKRYGMSDFVKKFKNSAYGDFYLAAVAAIVTVAWIAESAEFGFVALVLLACISLVLLDDILPLTAPIFYAMCMIFSSDVADFIFMWPTFIPLGIAVVIFAVRNRSRLRIGKMFFPQLAVSAALLLGGVGVVAVSDYVRALPSVLFLGIGILAIYVLLFQYVKIDEKRDIGLFFSKMLMWFGVAVMVELVVVIIRSGQPPSEWGHMVRDTGWGNENNIATILSLTAPMCFYISTRYRHGWAYVAMGVVQYAGIVLSFSRGGILMAVFTGPACAIYALVKAVDKKITSISYAVIIVALLVCFGLVFDKVMDVFKSLLGQGFGVSGRDLLYAEALDVFTKFPFLGAGVGYNGPNYDINTMQFYWFHSTLFQVLANMGVVGFIAYAYYYIVRFGIAFKGWRNPFNIFVIIAWIGFEGYSMMDTGTFVPFPTMALVMTTAMIMEFTNKAEPMKGEVDEYNRTFKRGAVKAKARYYDSFTPEYARTAEALAD